MKERRERKITKKKEKARRKREERIREEERIKEGRKMKSMRKHLRHKEKVSKGVASGHWKFRGITEDQVKKILGRGFGEEGLKDDQVKEILKKWHRRRRGEEEGDTGDRDSSSIVGSEGKRRRPSTMSSTSMRS